MLLVYGTLPSLTLRNSTGQWRKPTLELGCQWRSLNRCRCMQITRIVQHILVSLKSKFVGLTLFLSCIVAKHQMWSMLVFNSEAFIAIKLSFSWPKCIFNGWFSIVVDCSRLFLCLDFLEIQVTAVCWGSYIEALPIMTARALRGGFIRMK